MLKFLRFNIGGFFDGYDEVRLWIYKHSAKYEILSMNFNRIENLDLYENKRLLVKNPKQLSKWDTLGVNSWADEYSECCCDGTQWRLTYREEGKKTRHISGSNGYPPQWNQFMEWLDALMPEMQFAKEKEDKGCDIDSEIEDKWYDLQEAKTDSEREAAWRNLLEGDGWKLSKEDMDYLMDREGQSPEGDV